jgi:hypothetical protein
MKIAGKAFREYLAVSKSFWMALFIIMVLTVLIRRSNDVPGWIQPLLSVSGALVIIGAGWTSVRRHGLELRQVAIVALFLSIAVHWSLPIFHSAGEVAYLIFINSFVYTLMAIIGALLAKISAK